MNNKFLIEEFTQYKVLLFANKQMNGTDYGIRIDIPSGIVRVYFSKNDKKSSYTENGDKYRFEVHVDSSKYLAWIDLLRNEEPLFFYYNFESNNSSILTSMEPVGEGELKLTWQS